MGHLEFCMIPQQHRFICNRQVKIFNIFESCFDLNWWKCCIVTAIMITALHCNDHNWPYSEPVILYMCYNITGYNQEDSLIINEHAFYRGYFATNIDQTQKNVKKKTEVALLQKRRNMARCSKKARRKVRYRKNKITNTNGCKL